MLRVLVTFLIAASLFAGADVRAGIAAPAGPDGAAIDFLLQQVAGADVAFIRNSREYKAARAAEHMQRKYEHFRKEIRTAEDFIRLTATRSLVSGKPYTVRFPDGRIVRSADWLTDLLREYRLAVAASPVRGE